MHQQAATVHKAQMCSIRLQSACDVGTTGPCDFCAGRVRFSAVSQELTCLDGSLLLKELRKAMDMKYSSHFSALQVVSHHEQMPEALTGLTWHHLVSEVQNSYPFLGSGS